MINDGGEERIYVTYFPTYSCSTVDVTAEFICSDTQDSSGVPGYVASVMALVVTFYILISQSCSFVVNSICHTGLQRQSSFNLDHDFGLRQLNEHDRAVFEKQAKPCYLKHKANQALSKLALDHMSECANHSCSRHRTTPVTPNHRCQTQAPGARISPATSSIDKGLPHGQSSYTKVVT